VKVIAFFCTKFSIIPSANLPSAHPIIYTFHTICKKENISYCILIIKEKIPYPYPLLFFPGQAKISPWARRKKSWADSKKQISYKTTIKQRQKIILQGKKIAIT